LGAIKNLAGQTAIYGLSSIIPKFLSYFLVPLYTYYFEPAEYGIIGDLYSLMVILNIIVTYGMETAFFWFTKNESKNKNIYSTAFISVLCTTIVFITVTLLFSNDIANLLDYPDKKEYIVWLAIILGLDAIAAIPFVKLRSENKAFKFSLIKIASIVINVILNVVYVVIFPYLLQKGIITDSFILYNKSFGVGYILIANIVSSACSLLLLFKDFPFQFKFDYSLWNRMLKYSLPLLAAGLAGSINDVIDRQFIKYMSPEGVDSMAQLGIYFANTKIAVILTVFIQTFRFAAEPFFFNYEKENDSKFVFANIMKFFVFISLVVYLLTYGNMYAIKYFINSDYWSGLNIVPIVLASNVLVGIYVNQSIWYKLSGKTLFGVLIIAIGAGFTLLLNYFLVPVYGYTASAYIRFLCYLIMVIICYYFGNKYYRIPYDLKRISYYFVITLLGVIIIYFLSGFAFYIQMIFNNLIIVLFVLLFIKKENLSNTLINSVKNIHSKILK
jgi:O-antigen/teichoic acid export membrane protein